jgi:glycosyltransferase 2 family protein
LVGVCLWLAFRDVSLAAVGQLLSAAGAQLAWVPLPFLLAQLADAKACQLLFERLERAPPFARMFQSQVAGEASTLSLPMGFLVGESLRPWLLSGGNPARLASSIAAVSGRKSLLIIAEGVWIALAVSLAPHAASQLSAQLFGGSWLLVLSVLLSAVFVGVGLLMASFLAGGHCAGSLFQGLARNLPPRFRPAIARAESYFTRTDAQLQRVFARPRRPLVVPALLYVCVWVLEGLEVWLILHLLRVDVPITTAFYIEAIVASCRSLLPLTPAGLGVQDAGYVACFTALGLPGALGVGAAFCLAKRTRELGWCALGAVCWALARRQTIEQPLVVEQLLEARPSVPVLLLDSEPP